METRFTSAGGGLRRICYVDVIIKRYGDVAYGNALELVCSRGPTSSSLTQASSARPRLYSYTGVSNLHVGDCAQRLCVQLRHVRV
jgi:hypothetical protein